jgi:hypothetical protein
METSPVIDKNIIELFNKKLNKTPMIDGSEPKKEINADEDEDKLKEFFEKLTTPEICDSLVTVKKSIYRPSILEKKQRFLKDLIQDIRVSHGENQNPKDKLIRDFWETFRKEIKRPPTKEELLDNLVTDVDLYIDESMIDQFLSEVTTNM